MIKRVYLEITNACNLRCPFCTNKKGDRFLPFSDIQKITDEIKEITPYIYLHVLGEPMMHPFFHDILNDLDQKGMKLQLVTNGTLLKKYPDLFKHPCLRKLSISLHSFEKDDSDYFNTIDTLIEAKRNCTLELRFFEPEKLPKDVKSYLTSLKERYPYEDTKKQNSYKMKENTYIYYDHFFHWPDIKDPFVSSDGSCRGAKDMIAILSNGDVTICCLDSKGHNKIGNIFEQSLPDILSSPQYKKVLKDLQEHHLSFELCQKCTYRTRFL